MTQAERTARAHRRRRSRRGSSETKDELFKLRFTHATGQLDNYHRITELRREIARISTLLREREIAAARSAGES